MKRQEASSLHNLAFQLKTQRSRSSTTTSSTFLRGTTNGISDPVQRNIFHSNYRKPIVLIGRSSEESLLSSSSGNELIRIAQDFVEREIPIPSQRQVLVLKDENAPSGKDDWADYVKTLSSSVSIITDLMDYSWPTVIVIDSNLLQSSQHLIQSLYNDQNCLSIYIHLQDVDEKEDQFFFGNSDYELCIRSSDTDDAWSHLQWEFSRLLARARLIPAIPGDTERTLNTAHLTMGPHTFFLSLTFPTIEQVEPYVEQMCKDVDAMEYRTDLLDCQHDRFELIYGLQQLRKYCRPYALRAPALPSAGGASVLEDCMPVVYTVRTANQAGTFPDETPEDIQRMFDMLEWGLRAGVEVLDVESAWDRDLTLDLLDLAETRYSSQILGSHHVVGKEISTEDAVLLFEQCALDGRAHAAKVVLSVNSDEKDRMAYEAGLISQELARQESRPVIPHISLVLGDDGQFSRVINLNFTPVTHETLPIVAAPGQMTPSEIMTTRILTRIFQKKNYAILGHKISYSVSPQMHGAAFEAVKLPHQYVRADVETVQEFVDSDFFKSGSFGGTSVTIPHKQSIIPHVDVLSKAASDIGSVNTVIAKDEFIDDNFRRVIYGDNTDWKGIFNPLRRHLGDTIRSGDYALILGAGGTARAAAYVAKKLGLSILYSNRTPSKATELANTFGGQVLDNLSEDGESSLGSILHSNPSNRVRVVISTLPAASNFELPSWLLEGQELPVVFDVNYKPYNTKLLIQAGSAGCALVRGSEMLWEQGVAQFELWTGRTAPYGVMKQVVLDNCLEEASKI